MFQKNNHNNWLLQAYAEKIVKYLPAQYDIPYKEASPVTAIDDFTIFIKKLVKPAVLFLLSLCCFSSTISQQAYWQQQVHYTIDVSLNDTDNTLNAFEKIEYTNHSPDTLTYIWFHLWPNAYKNDKTAFSEQLLANGSTKFYFSKEEDRGYINHLDFKVNGITATLEEDAHNIDIVKLLLPARLPPGRSIIITTPFHEKLPYNISRGGHVGQTYQVTQWYPKPAVYDAHGWHPMPYLEQGEFYSEYGSFNVRITVPENYIVASSGDLQNEDELNRLKETGKLPPTRQKNYLAFQNLNVQHKKNEAVIWENHMPSSSKKTKTLNYTLDNVHDFAWFASKLFLVRYDTVRSGGNTIDVFSYYHPWQQETWKSSPAFIKDAVHFYTKHVGAYPYLEVSAVAGSDGDESDGMEYPTITLVTFAGDDAHSLDAIIAHEVGHNWFYGIIGSNERDHAWMDEGVNTYYQKRYEQEKYGFSDELGVGQSKFMQQHLPEDVTAVPIGTLEKIKKDEPMDTASAAYSTNNYGLMVYEKTSIWMKHLHDRLGDTVLDSAMHHYYNTWKFKHPYPADFKASIEESSGQNIDVLYNKLFVTGAIQDSTVRKSIRFATLFNFKETNKYNYISVGPADGVNAYDKIMIGILIHNCQLPPNRFNFFIAPVYATGSQALNGAARFSFSTFTKRTWLETSLSAEKFSINAYTKDDGSKIYPGIIKIIPSVKLTLYNKSAISSQQWSFRLRSFILKEDKLKFSTINISPDTSIDIVSKAPVNIVINQFRVSVSDNRILYPYDADVTIDQGAEFLRAGFTANYFFNYTKDDDGMHARFFAGKFFYLVPKTFTSSYETQRYQLDMTGPRGNEDYTYSDYFVGRNAFSGIESQQIMERDGFFKIRTDLFSNKIGKTDDWLMALNFSGDIPPQINPFKVLPFKLPVGFFVDIGTYSGAWKDNPATGKFLYDAGLQLSLLKSVVNIYFPLLYSKVYSNYLKSTQGNNRFWKTVSFNINLRPFKLNKISRNIPL